MTFIKTRIFLPGLFLLITPSLLAQQSSPKSQTPAKTAPSKKDAVPAQQAPAATTPDQPKANTKPDQAAAYYHFSLAHMYEEMMAMYGRSEYANKAIEEYRLAIENDPSSEYLNASLAELYAKTGRIRDAVLEAQDIIKREPNNLEAHKLLGRIYLRSLGDLQPGTQSREVLSLAIEQYEAITKIEPKNADNHLLLGSALFSEQRSRPKRKLNSSPRSILILVQKKPSPILAYLYNDEGANNKAADLLKTVPEGQRSAKIYSALGNHLRAAKRLQECHRFLPASVGHGQGKSGRDARPGPEPVE